MLAGNARDKRDERLDTLARDVIAMNIVVRAAAALTCDRLGKFGTRLVPAVRGIWIEPHGEDPSVFRRKQPNEVFACVGISVVVVVEPCGEDSNRGASPRREYVAWKEGRSASP